MTKIDLAPGQFLAGQFLPGHVGPFAGLDVPCFCGCAPRRGGTIRF